MKKLLAGLLLSTAIVSSDVAMAREAKINIEFNNSGGFIYLAIYVTKPDDTFDSTVWIAGGNTRYYGDLRGWLMSMRTSNQRPKIDGITGASISFGQKLSLNVDFADAMIDAGYKLHVETVVQNGGDYIDDAVVPITSNRQRTAGTGRVTLLDVQM